MSNTEAPIAPDLPENPIRPPRRAVLVIQEVLGKEAGAFTVGLGLSSQDPEQVKYFDDVSVPPIDLVAMVLVDIIKTTPKAFIARLERLQERMVQTAAAIEGGEDPVQAAQKNLTGELLNADEDAAAEQ